MNESDLISRQAAIRFIRDKVSLSLFMKRSIDKADKACMELCDMLDRDLPSAQPKQGKNIYNTVHGHCEFKCSVCGAEAHIVEGGELDGGYFNYCPNCGAEMEPES